MYRSGGSGLDTFREERVWREYRSTGGKSGDREKAAA
jgi:hypothetical protein